MAVKVGVACGVCSQCRKEICRPRPTDIAALRLNKASMQSHVATTTKSQNFKGFGIIRMMFLQMFRRTAFLTSRLQRNLTCQTLSPNSFSVDCTISLTIVTHVCFFSFKVFKCPNFDPCQGIISVFIIAFSPVCLDLFLMAFSVASRVCLSLFRVLSVIPSHVRSFGFSFEWAHVSNLLYSRALKVCSIALIGGR